jgi:hypothetical protein
VRRHLKLKREVLVALDTNELKEVNGGTYTPLNDIIALETIHCDIETAACAPVTRVNCTSGHATCNSRPVCW